MGNIVRERACAVTEVKFSCTVMDLQGVAQRGAIGGLGRRSAVMPGRRETERMRGGTDGLDRTSSARERTVTLYIVGVALGIKSNCSNRTQLIAFCSNEIVTSTSYLTRAHTSEQVLRVVIA